MAPKKTSELPVGQIWAIYGLKMAYPFQFGFVIHCHHSSVGGVDLQQGGVTGASRTKNPGDRWAEKMPMNIAINTARMTKVTVDDKISRRFPSLSPYNMPLFTGTLGAYLPYGR